MASDKTTFPMLPAKNWWALRKKFQASMPSKVTPGYIASVLGMSEKSASNNVLPYLRTMGLVDADDKPADRANEWRFDETYPKVCNDIKAAVYDQELLDAFHGPVADRASVERWFATKTGVGEVAARRMASQFELLAEADPTKAEDSSTKKQLVTKTTKPSKATGGKTGPTVKNAESNQQQVISPPVLPQISIPPTPSLHIDVQIHLSPEAPADQIDRVFESMAKHLKNLYSRPKNSE